MEVPEERHCVEQPAAELVQIQGRPFRLHHGDELLGRRPAEILTLVLEDEGVHVLRPEGPPEQLRLEPTSRLRPVAPDGLEADELQRRLAPRLAVPRVPLLAPLAAAPDVRRASPLIGVSRSPRALPRSTGYLVIRQPVHNFRLHIRFKLRCLTRPPETSERHTGQTSTRSKPDRPRFRS